MATWPTTPHDFTPFEVVTASILDANIRDPLQLAPNAIVTTQGDSLIVLSANTFGRVAAGNYGDVWRMNSAEDAQEWAAPGALDQFAFISTNEATSSTFPANLATPGPSVTVTILASGEVEIEFDAEVYNNTSGQISIMGVDDGSGIVSGTQVDVGGTNYGANDLNPGGRTKKATGYTPGDSVTFTLKYGNDGGADSAGFRDRSLKVRPL
ncbi:MAG: hypothetical protein DWQ07_14195 [Chloroflexi bacterium]|nr:MAG: hypothetical protein DWQ07_14195 [Chloroflexota bacterium]MBL1195766.1 hypothetical protein [Chloroflexota bacterium]NOH13055.1 hypothetical protein [Chloroflexota bacterium]